MVSDHLTTGKDRAVTMGDLAKALHTSKRDIREMVQRERRAGILICACADGYFMPETIKQAA